MCGMSCHGATCLGATCLWGELSVTQSAVCQLSLEAFKAELLLLCNGQDYSARMYS